LIAAPEQLARRFAVAATPSLEDDLGEHFQLFRLFAHNRLLSVGVGAPSHTTTNRVANSRTRQAAIIGVHWGSGYRSIRILIESRLQM
jgi:hypothetical protein